MLKTKNQLSHEQATTLHNNLSKKYYTEIYFHTDLKTWIVTIVGRKDV